MNHDKFQSISLNELLAFFGEGETFRTFFPSPWWTNCFRFLFHGLSITIWANESAQPVEWDNTKRAIKFFFSWSKFNYNFASSCIPRKDIIWLVCNEKFRNVIKLWHKLEKTLRRDETKFNNVKKF